MAKKKKTAAKGGRESDGKFDDPLEADTPATSTESAVADPDQAADPPRVAATPSEALRRHERRQSVTIEIPLGPPPNGARRETRHVDVQFRKAAQREMMRRVFVGLDHAGARMADGRRVINAADAVRWLIDELVAAAEA